jgi:UPF0755 protein
VASRTVKWLLPLALLVLVAGALGFGWLRLARLAVEPGPQATQVRIHVTPGEPLRAVLADLAHRGALREPRSFELWVRLTGRSPRIRAGTYDIAANASPADILAQLAAGRVVLEALTVIEGWTFADLRRALEKHPRVKATLRGKSDAEVMATLGRSAEHPEGRFFPDTYRFADGTTDREILTLAYQRMADELAAAWEARAADLPVHSSYEALILASVVEKETGLATERPQIAGVFSLRLKQGMRLQSDPTIIYGLGAAYDGDIRSRDLTADTPYNTYTRNGLPPTPIALPGRESLRAATRPLETGALYFVATGKLDGAHVFSRTYDEHREAVARMLGRLHQRATPRRVEAPSKP